MLAHEFPPLLDIIEGLGASPWRISRSSIRRPPRLATYTVESEREAPGLSIRSLGTIQCVSVTDHVKPSPFPPAQVAPQIRSFRVSPLDFESANSSVRGVPPAPRRFLQALSIVIDLFPAAPRLFRPLRAHHVLNRS